uniref:Uncharacterized protein n=1 Tax=Panagrolaimus superbus TaxID=310955 RepID=A0A914Y9K4_9BILA
MFTLLKQELLAFKPESALKRRNFLRRSNSNLQRQGSFRRSDSDRPSTCSPPIPSSLDATVEEEQESAQDVNNNKIEDGGHQQQEVPRQSHSETSSCFLPSIPEQPYESAAESYEVPPLPSASQLVSLSSTFDDERENEDAVEVGNKSEAAKDDDDIHEHEDTTLRPEASTSPRTHSPVPSIDSAIEDCDEAEDILPSDENCEEVAAAENVVHHLYQEHLVHLLHHLYQDFLE